MEQPYADRVDVACAGREKRQRTKEHTPAELDMQGLEFPDSPNDGGPPETPPSPRGVWLDSPPLTPHPIMAHRDGQDLGALHPNIQSGDSQPEESHTGDMYSSCRDKPYLPVQSTCGIILHILRQYRHVPKVLSLWHPLISFMPIPSTS